MYDHTINGKSSSRIEIIQVEGGYDITARNDNKIKLIGTIRDRKFKRVVPDKWKHGYSQDSLQLLQSEAALLAAIKGYHGP